MPTTYTPAPTSTQLEYIAQAFGHSGVTLRGWLADIRYTQADVAYLLGTTPDDLAARLGKPGPPHPLPLNWTSESTTGQSPYCPTQYNGIAAIPYAGPARPGFTYGPPVYPADLPPPIVSQND